MNNAVDSKLETKVLDDRFRLAPSNEVFARQMNGVEVWDNYNDDDDDDRFLIRPLYVAIGLGRLGPVGCVTLFRG
jgi:hypothetical protein